MKKYMPKKKEMHMGDMPHYMEHDHHCYPMHHGGHHDYHHGGYGYGYGYGCGNTFAIIVVLFILLIIVGAAAFHHGGKGKDC
ncbi:YjcZ family sporulation protein [Pseudalkalibacillus sp. R45]|uniref:YjcZ family sporulation protein n=1 Tax=Pseudalkalibacillus sp. R45 TaxID=3457433 RepID=UPI003FCD902F